MFITEMESEAESWGGIDAREWLAIPKYVGWHRDTIEQGEAQEKFALDFLAQCGFEKYTVKKAPPAAPAGPGI